MTLMNFRNILNSISENVTVYHQLPLKDDGNYIVWEETEINNLIADSRACELVHRIRLFYFTKTEYDDIPYAIQAALDDNYISYGTCKIEYLPDVARWAYTWEVEA